MALTLSVPLSFYDKHYFVAHPEIELNKKADVPDENKAVGDARLLLPMLKDFFRKHPLIYPVTFLGGMLLTVRRSTRRFSVAKRSGTKKMGAPGYLSGRSFR